MIIKSHLFFQTSGVALARFPNKFPYRRGKWVEVVFGSNNLTRFVRRKNTQWIPNSHIKLIDAIHLYGQKKFTEWNGREQNAGNYDASPDPPWEWDVPDHARNPTSFIISEKYQIIEKSENEAIKWWRGVEPILVNEWKQENKCHERWADCVQQFRSDLSSGEFFSFVSLFRFLSDCCIERDEFGNATIEEFDEDFTLFR